MAERILAARFLARASGRERLVCKHNRSSGARALPSNKSLQPTSLPSVACFNGKGRLVGSAAAERGCWADERYWCEF